MKNFPQLHLACADDHLRPALSYVIIQDGHFVCTNSLILIKVPVSLWLDTPIELLEGKAIHKTAIAQICAPNTARVVFHDTGITFFNKQNEGFKTYYYDAIATPKTKYFEIFDRATGAPTGTTFAYPNWESTIPNPDNDTVSYSRFGIDPNLLSIISKCFYQSIGKFYGLKMETIGHGYATTTCCTKPISVTPILAEDGKPEYALLMPILT